jgi:hypothetical protein
MSLFTITPTTIPFTHNEVNINDKTDDKLSILNGIYKVSASSQLSEENAAYNVFNDTSENKKGWSCAKMNSSDYKQDPYDDKHTISKYIGGGDDKTYWNTHIGNKSVNIAGEWIQIQVPNRIFLVKYSILIDFKTEFRGNNFPKVFFVAGSNDGKKWSIVDQQYLKNIPADISKPVSFDVYTPNKYKFFRFIFHQLFKGNVITISQINMFGSSNIVVNDEPFSTMNDSIISPTILRNMSSNDYAPYNKYENKFSNHYNENVIEGATTMSVSDMHSEYGNTYLKMTTEDKYKKEYSESVIRSDKNKNFKDGITEDARHMLIQQNNMFLLATLTVAFLTIGAIVISR